MTTPRRKLLTLNEWIEQNHSAEVREATGEECANIALAIDSGRGNEKEIAKFIRALTRTRA